MFTFVLQKQVSPFLRKRLFATSSASRLLPPAVALGNGIKLQKLSDGSNNSNTATDHSRPLAIVCGWLTAKERQMKPYLNWYHDRGIETMSFSAELNHILTPKVGMKHMEKVLDATIDVNPSKIILHCFSTGGYMTGQSLRLMTGNKDKYESSIEKKIQAQIYDSINDLYSIPIGVASHFVPERDGIHQKLMHAAIQNTLQGYLTLTKNSSGVEHKAASDAFHNNFLSAPSLWYYSLDDVIANYIDCEKVIDRWRAEYHRDVEQCIWEKSPHIQHARLDPKRYFDTLNAFLTKLKI